MRAGWKIVCPSTVVFVLAYALAILLGARLRQLLRPAAQFAQRSE